MAGALKIKQVVLVGGGVGSSTFTKALKNLPISLKTVVSSFDDGGSTGMLRRDYGGFALGDFRQCILANLDLPPEHHAVLNYRFGRGILYGTNIGNLLIKSFLHQYPTDRIGVAELHRQLRLRHEVIPVSYTFTKLQGILASGELLHNQDAVATYLSFADRPIKELGLSKKAMLNPDAKIAMLKADFLCFAPGHFFTSVLPHLYVNGFADAWKRSKAKKVWFVNLLAHRGQDNVYTLKDYLGWFQKKLGKKPFDIVVINKRVPQRVAKKVEDRFMPLRITSSDIGYVKRLGMGYVVADLVSPTVRTPELNDTVKRAPLRHDTHKIEQFFVKCLL